MIGAGRRGQRLWAVLAALAALGGARASAAPPPLLADLSSRQIDITTGFVGAELLLFGAVDGPGDVVVVIRSQPGREVVRRKERTAGIWVNVDSMWFDETPGFYQLASTRPLAEIARGSVLTRAGIGSEYLGLRPQPGRSAAHTAEYRAALIRNKERLGLYGVGTVQVRSDRLFSTRLEFPANVLTGRYSAEVYLFRGGRIVSRNATPLVVRKVGLSEQIYEFANRRSAAYGAIAIAIALVAGWLAGVAFRRA